MSEKRIHLRFGGQLIGVQYHFLMGVQYHYISRAGVRVMYGEPEIQKNPKF